MREGTTYVLACFLMSCCAGKKLRCFFDYFKYYEQAFVYNMLLLYILRSLTISVPSPNH